MLDIEPRSFLFAGKDIAKAFGIMIEEVEDLLIPALRKRTVIIPNRQGEYDHGAIAYDCRQLTLHVGTRQPLTRQELREVSLFLSTKSTIRLWNEPEKYYIGRLYEPIDMDRAGRLRKFSLGFTCEPFAYGDPIEIPVKTGENVISYPGTAPAGFQLKLKNTGNNAITRIQVKVVGKG